VSQNYFDERIARTYRDKWPHLFDPAFVNPAVDFLAELAGTGAALELGIGTGRLAVPLSRRGVRVHGIELSPAMVDEMRNVPGSESIAVTIGDFATTRVEGTFSLAYLVRNTIMNLTTQDAQVACFQNVAGHLEDGGRFVMEVGVPALQRLPPGETVRPLGVGTEYLGFEVYDVVTQSTVCHHFWLKGGGVETFSAPVRYVWPSELDLMARLAGMSLVARWSTWTRKPFTAESGSHISVWRLGA
jgi:hypothetical protein